MLALLFMGALNWAKTASTANSFLAAESLAAHMRNPLALLEKSGFDQKGTSGASVATKGGMSGPGAFTNVSESMSAQAAAYQARAAGTNAGSAYVVNGVKFDGYMNGVLIDAKASYSQFVNVNTGQFQPWFNGANSMVDQAKRQVIAANGTPIQWRFAEESAANATRTLFQQRNVKGIDIVHFP